MNLFSFFSHNKQHPPTHIILDDYIHAPRKDLHRSHSSRIALHDLINEVVPIFFFFSRPVVVYLYFTFYKR